MHTARPELQDEQIKAKEGRLAFKEFVYIFISNNCWVWVLISFRGFVNIISCPKLNLRPNDIDTLQKKLNHLNQRMLVCQQCTAASRKVIILWVPEMSLVGRSDLGSFQPSVVSSAKARPDASVKDQTK